MSRALLFAVFAVSVVTVPTPVSAQAAAPAQTQASPSAGSNDLPVSLDRIKRRLREQDAESTRFENFQLITSLNVYGRAPRFTLFEPDDREGIPSSVGPVRYGGMTHAEFLQQVTPRNFQAPVMNLSGAAFSLSNWIADKRREARRKKEAEARKP